MLSVLTVNLLVLFVKVPQSVFIVYQKHLFFSRVAACVIRVIIWLMKMGILLIVFSVSWDVQTVIQVLTVPVAWTLVRFSTKIM
jgi:hypothetical protein